MSAGGARAAHGVSGPRPRSYSGQRVALLRHCFVVAGFGSIPREVLCSQGALCFLCVLATCQPGLTHNREEGTGAGGGLAFHCKRPHVPPGRTGGALGQAALSPLRMKGEQPVSKDDFQLCPRANQNRS